MEHNEAMAQVEHHVGYAIYCWVWLSLLILTGTTVAAAGIHFGPLSVLIALFIATLKAILVISFFMHLKYEERQFRFMLLVMIVTLGIILGLTFVDVAFR